MRCNTEAMNSTIAKNRPDILHNEEDILLHHKIRIKLIPIQKSKSFFGPFALTC